jgi:hypothetical protein
MFDNLLQEIKLYFQKINDKGYFWNRKVFFKNRK